MAKKKRGLGKGLSALIPDEPKEEIIEEAGEKIVSLDISLIEPNDEQPRRHFDEQSLYELTKSIEAHGVLQPIIVRKKGKGYQIVAGERRWRAAKEAGLKEIPCLVKELEQIKSTEIALIENIQREDLNPIEEALAYNGLMDKYDFTQEEVADIVGKSRSYIANVTRLLNLDERVLEYISTGRLSSGHGRALLSIRDSELQYGTAIKIMEKGLSVRETEKLIKEMKNKKKNKRKNKVQKKKDPILIELEDNLTKVLGTKVQISKGRKKGKIEIEYYSDEDLERILDIISNA
ncbi:ParB/RepB/Spo0J family partition protein [Caldisalinibacter kiritimatiensis]|uniref:Chromosome (Plasmid) partitioning protein ParB / Stage 0 sporulation protein J n=1 Tax=Caldisalinibacter kiritimatiensis TaxID=1304284 RepID=R1AQM4_9FIRM|nr:ParB/RepB/Spo0J family partition protein [Caldisalinibacter kiritimatiensis]EOC99422.1 Chromosome (plasmid) partitioning protein ParB / Stage 0 sporulation protein J [Caldisalinibacter kiritimatiensis]